MKNLKKIIELLDSNERKNAIILFIMVLIMAFLDTLGVVSILPFIAVLSNPQIIETNIIMKNIFEASLFFGVENNQEFFLFLGVIVFLLLIISLIFKAITTYAQLRFVFMHEYSLSKRLIEGYLNQPYSWFLNHNSANLGKTILSEVNHIVTHAIYPMIELISKGTISISIIILLVLLNPQLAILVSLSLGGSYAIIFYLVKKYLHRIGQKRLKSNELRFTSINEAFNASKEIKIGSLEQVYIKFFSDNAKIYAKSLTSSQTINQIPRFILEIIAFGGIMLIILYLMTQTGNFNNSLPMIGLYVFAGYRLMPSLQIVYSSSTQISFIGPSLDALIKDLKNLKYHSSNKNIKKLTFKKELCLREIYYSYPNESRTALKNIKLSIKTKNTIGIVGATGSGKTTLVDIILGLLTPQNGILEIDGKIISKKNLRSWQKIIGYVPQNIFLSDDTIANNIAFGNDPNNVNLKKIKKVSKIANLADFIENELPKKYQTFVGERGVRLSGGQLQRIGIARALYNDPQVLIFDEATSALDNITEQKVMKAINDLKNDMTIILIAHRLSTIKNCDNIFFLEKGELKSQGGFERLKKINKSFNKMVSSKNSK